MHDSTSQLLAALQLQLGRLRRSAPPEAGWIVGEIQATIEEIRAQFRSLDLDEG